MDVRSWAAAGQHPAFAYGSRPSRADLRLRAAGGQLGVNADVPGMLALLPNALLASPCNRGFRAAQSTQSGVETSCTTACAGGICSRGAIDRSAWMPHVPTHELVVIWRDYVVYAPAYRRRFTNSGGELSRVWNGTRQLWRLGSPWPGAQSLLGGSSRGKLPRA